MASSQLPRHPRCPGWESSSQGSCKEHGHVTKGLNSRGFNHLTALFSVLQLSVQGMWAQWPSSGTEGILHAPGGHNHLFAQGSNSHQRGGKGEWAFWYNGICHQCPRVDKGRKSKTLDPLCWSWLIQCIHSPLTGQLPCPSPAAGSAVSRQPELREKEDRELPGIDLQWEQEGWRLSAYNSKSMWNTEML